MKSLFIPIAILLAIIVNMAFLGQNNEYYWYRNGQKVILEKIQNKKYIVFENLNNQDELRTNLNIPNVQVYKFSNTSVYSTINPYKSKDVSESKWALIESNDFGNVKLTDKENIIYEAPLFFTSKGEEVGISHFFYVKLNKSSDITMLEELAQKNNIEILGSNKFMPLWFTLSCSKYSKGNALEMANLFYESGLFAASEPNFMVDNLLQCVNDTFFNNQWGLKNTGQNGGTADVDINACQAWLTTTGSSSVVVAVFDDGIELNHPDMPNIFRFSFDTETGTSPSQVRGSHGTACAGIIGANSDNSLGVAGIAPNCPLMSISNDFIFGTNFEQQLANGLNWAWQNAASVISNSWGHDALSPGLINDAINNALTQGRNGLGCVVIFASGNDNSSVVFPASSTAYSNEDLLAVGAMSPCGERKNPSSCDGEGWGSNFGSQLDIIAPGVLIPTTDRQGSNGYDPTDYLQDFNGTSSATPHVAAIAALILSKYPGLTQEEVVDIIEFTAQKVGGYNYQTTSGRPNGTWDDEMGYGLVDACASLREAIKREAYITGPEAPNAVCDDDYTLDNVPSTVSVTWNATPCYLFQNCSGTGTTANIKAASSSSSGPGTITFTVQTGCGNIQISKNIEVGPFNSAYITVTGTAGVCPGNQYVYTANTPTGHRPGYSYSWTYPSGWFVEGQMDDWIRLRVPLYNPNYGTVRVSVTNECGPSGYTGITVYPGWGCGGYYSVFPNPSDSEIEIIANSQDEQGENDKVTVILLDETNRIALKDEISRNGGVINVSRLQKGSYILQIIDQNNKSIFRTHILIE